MAIYGIGASYDGDDVSQIFIDKGLVATGWDIGSAPDLHEFFRDINVGDIVYIKACNFHSPVTVKAIGIVMDDRVLGDTEGDGMVQIGRNVRWIHKKKFVLQQPANQKNNVRANTIYREYHPDYISKIMSIVNKSI